MSDEVTVVVRRGSTVEKHGCAGLADALDVLEHELRAAATAADRRSTKALFREYGPEDQVVARGELRARRLSAGVDVRGDGSTAAWIGRIRKRLVEPEGREDAFAALRRELAGR